MASKKQRIREHLEQRGPGPVNEAEWRELLTALAPISESYLRDLVADAGVEVEAPFGGVRQHSLAQLESSLRSIGEAYRHALSRGDRQRARICRDLVIQAKDRAKLLSRSPRLAEEKRKLKEEMAQWMLVWLDDPDLFESWAAARKRVLG